MPRHKTDKVTKELLAARREAIKRLYFELGGDRSFARLVPIVKEKFGGPTQRVIQEWSRLEHWPQLARDYDAQRAATMLRQAEEIVAADDLDEAESLRAVARQHLRMVTGRTLGLKETRDAMAIIEAALRTLAELTGGARRRPDVRTVTANTLIIEGSPARRALAALDARLNALPALAQPPAMSSPAPASSASKPAARVLDLDALDAEARATGIPFEELLAEFDRDNPRPAPALAARPAPPAATAAPGAVPETVVDIRELQRDSAASGKSFAALIAERKAR